MARDLAVGQPEHFDPHLPEGAEAEIGDGLGGTEPGKIQVHDGERAVAAELDGRGAIGGGVGRGRRRAERRDVVRARVVENGDRGDARRAADRVAGARGQGERRSPADRVARTIGAGRERDGNAARPGGKRHRAGQCDVIHRGGGGAADLVVSRQGGGRRTGAGKRIQAGRSALRIGGGVTGDNADRGEILGRDVVDLDQGVARRVADPADLDRIAAGREFGDDRGVLGAGGEREGPGLGEGGVERGDVGAGAPIVVGGELDVRAGVADDGDGRIGE